MNTYKNNKFNLEFLKSLLNPQNGIFILCLLTFIITIINTYKIFMHIEPSLEKISQELPPNRITINDEQLDKMIERNHRIHDIVEQHIVGGLLIFGSLSIVLAFVARNWMSEQIKSKINGQINEQVNKSQEPFLKHITNTSNLMALLSWINDEDLISDFSLVIPSQAKIWKDNIEKTINDIKEKSPDIKITPVISVKLGDLYSYMAKYYSEEADYKKNINLKNKAFDMYNQALDRYKDAIDNKPKKIEDIDSIFWCQTYCKAGNVSTAIENYNTADTYYGESTKIMNSYYWSYHSQGDLFAKTSKTEKDQEAINAKYRKAINKYDEALKIHPTNAVTLYKKGIAYAYLDEDEEAIFWYKKALQFSNLNTWILHSWGDSLNKLWHYDEQISDWELEEKEREITDKYEKSVDSNYTRYKSVMEWGNVILKSAYFLDRKGSVQAAINKRKKAIEKYHEALKIAEYLDDNRRDIWYRIGDAELYNGNYTEANENYKKAMKEQDKAHGWQDEFEQDFRIWAKQGYVIDLVMADLPRGLRNYDIRIQALEELKQKMFTKAQEKFDHSFNETLQRITKTEITSHVFCNEEKKERVNALYNEAVFYLFQSEPEHAKLTLEDAKRIDINYLQELQDKDLDWGLFFRSEYNLRQSLGLTVKMYLDDTNMMG